MAKQTKVNLAVHFAQQNSVLSVCGMTHVSQSPLLTDVTCAECLKAVTVKMAAPPTARETEGTIKIVAAVAEAIRELGTVPSGHLYAHLMGRMTLEQYNRIIVCLKGTGLVTESAHLLKWVGPAKEGK